MKCLDSIGLFVILSAVWFLQEADGLSLKDELAAALAEQEKEEDHGPVSDRVSCCRLLVNKRLRLTDP